MMLRLLPVRLLRFSQWRRRAASRLLPGAIDGAAQAVAVGGEQREQSGEVAAVPLAVEVGFGKADVAARQHCARTWPRHGHAA